MIDRYSITLEPTALALVLGVDIPEDYVPHYNAAPTKLLPVITSQQPTTLSLFHWGLMTNLSNNKSLSPKLFNLPAESVLTKTSYKRQVKSHRCVIPMDGFYVWKQLTKKKKIPYYFFYPDHKAFAVAGLWEDAEDFRSFTMILQRSKGSLMDFQDNMPLILEGADRQKWLEVGDEMIEEIITSQPKNELASHTVSPAISNLDNNNSTLIVPAPASDQFGNYTLFN